MIVLLINDSLQTVRPQTTMMKVGRLNPTNQENWPNVFPYMALYWANVLAIVPTRGQFFWFVGKDDTVPG